MLVLGRSMHVWVRPMLRAMAAGGCPCDSKPCGMVIDRAAATGLSRHDERVRAAAAAADEQPGQRLQRSSRCATSCWSCSGSSVRTGCGSTRVIGHCWRRCCTGSRETCSADCTWWCARIPCSAGTATWSRAGTPAGPVRSAPAGPHRALDPRPGAATGPRESGVGGIAGFTASCWCSG